MPPEAWVPYTVSTKATWADPWTAQPNLICQQLKRAVMPTIDTAQLFWRVGRVLQPGTSVFADFDPLALVGSYVRIEIPSLSVEWIGYVANEGNNRAADRDEAGSRVISLQDQQFTAVGLEWFLDRSQMDSSVFYKSATEQDRIQRPVGYNTGLGDGRSISYEDRGNKDTRLSDNLPVFAQDPDHSEPWNALQAVENLLAYHAPKNQAGDPSPIEFSTIAVSPAYLEWYFPTVRTENRTVLDVLNQIIDRRRGLVWWFEYNTLADEMHLQVSSSLASSILLPGGETIPAAAATTPYNFDQDIAVNSATVRGDGSQRYDRVRVRGARRRSVMTVSISDNNLEPNWQVAAETAYKTAEGTDADKNDRFRRANQFDRVYQAFRIPSTWDGKVGDGQGGTKDFASPLLPPGSTSVIDGEPFNLHGMRLLRTMPLKAGFSYASAISPTSNLPANTKPEFLQPFCLAKHDTKFVFLDRAASHIDEDTSASAKLKYSYGLRPLAGEPGFEIKPGGGLPHALAVNHFDTGTPGASNVTPELDYEDLLFTVCAEWDSYCEGNWPTALPTAEPVQQLLISLPGNRYRLDWLAKNTVYDINDQGVPLTVGDGGPVQDDRRILEDLARLAYDWYQQPRASLGIDFKNVQQPVALGTLITTIGTPGDPTEQTINATLSQITIQPEVGQSSLSAGFAELDFRGLV